MSAIAQSLTSQQTRTCSAYFRIAARVPENRGERTPRRTAVIATAILCKRLIYAGDPKRGIAACASCHGPGAIGSARQPLQNKTNCILSSSCKHLLWDTPNDMDMPMRTIASALTESEIRALARAYANENAHGRKERKFGETGFYYRGRRDYSDGKIDWLTCSPASLLLFLCRRSPDNTPVGAETCSAGTPYSPGSWLGTPCTSLACRERTTRTHALPGDFGQEARNCLEKYRTRSDDAHMDYSDVVSVQIYLVDMSQFQEVNAIYKEYS